MRYRFSFKFRTRRPFLAAVACLISSAAFGQEDKDYRQYRVLAPVECTSLTEAEKVLNRYYREGYAPVRGVRLVSRRSKLYVASPNSEALILESRPRFQYKFCSTAEIYRQWLGRSGGLGAANGGIGFVLQGQPNGPEGVPGESDYDKIDSRIDQLTRDGWELLNVNRQGMLFRRDIRSTLSSDDAKATDERREKTDSGELDPDEWIRRVLVVVNRQFKSRFGRFARTLRELKAEGYIDRERANGSRGGYTYSYRATSSGWIILVAPSSDLDDMPTFRANETGDVQVIPSRRETPPSTK